MAASGGPAAGCGTQSAGHSPHSDTASPLQVVKEKNEHKCHEVSCMFCSDFDNEKKFVCLFVCVCVCVCYKP